MIMHDLDIIILSYAKDSYFKSVTEKAISSILINTSNYNVNIIVVESNKQLKNYQYPNTTTIYPKSKFGYNKYINIALKLSSSSLICVANNDLEFQPDWFSHILAAFDKNPDIKSISPICPINHKKYNIFPNSGLYYGYRTAVELAGWCIIFKKELRRFDLFDSNLKFWYCDNDYANTLIKYGIKHALATNSIVNHLESLTLKDESERRQKQLTYREHLYFDYKWHHKSWLKYHYRKLRFDFSLIEKLTDFTIGKITAKSK